jgi:hypothetical protein
MKKLFETSLGNGSETAFEYQGQRVLDISKLPEILEAECNPYRTKEDTGVIVYMSREEFDRIEELRRMEESVRKMFIPKVIGEPYKAPHFVTGRPDRID